MVLHQNINVGQRVEVDLGWGGCKGVVAYKGSVTSKKGDWVGVHLEDKVGNCDGMVSGRRYFQCQGGFGLFVRANRIRFIPIQRCLYNRYHRVDRESFVDEPLFGTVPKPDVRNGPYDPIEISNKYHEKIRTQSFDDTDLFIRRHHHHLRHSISATQPAVTMKRPRSVTLTYSSRPVHTEYDTENFFITSPSIPKTHMPFTALKGQVRRGWENSHYVREMSVPTGRETMKFSQWNDVTA